MLTQQYVLDPYYKETPYRALNNRSVNRQRDFKYSDCSAFNVSRSSILPYLPHMVGSSREFQNYLFINRTVNNNSISNIEPGFNGLG